MFIGKIRGLRDLSPHSASLHFQEIILNNFQNSKTDDEMHFVVAHGRHYLLDSYGFNAAVS